MARELHDMLGEAVWVAGPTHGRDVVRRDGSDGRARLARPHRPNVFLAARHHVSRRMVGHRGQVRADDATGVHGGFSWIPRNLHKYAKFHARLGGHVPACWGLGGMRYRVQLCELRKRGLKGHFQSRPKLPI